MRLLHLPRPTSQAWTTVALLFGGALTMLIAGEAPSAKPAAVAADWTANPEVALRLAADQVNELLRINRELESKLSLMAWATGAAATVLAIARLLPGPAGKVADMAWAIMAPRMLKQEDQKREMLSRGFLQVAEIMRSFPKNSKLGEVIDKLDRRLPEDVKLAYREWERSQSKRPDSSEG